MDLGNSLWDMRLRMYARRLPARVGQLVGGMIALFSHRAIFVVRDERAFWVFAIGCLLVVVGLVAGEVARIERDIRALLASVDVNGPPIPQGSAYRTSAGRPTGTGAAEALVRYEAVVPFTAASLEELREESTARAARLGEFGPLEWPTVQALARGRMLELREERGSPDRMVRVDAVALFTSATSEALVADLTARMNEPRSWSPLEFDLIRRMAALRAHEIMAGHSPGRPFAPAMSHSEFIDPPKP